MPAGTNLEAIWDQNRCQDHFRCRTTLDDAHMSQMKMLSAVWSTAILGFDSKLHANSTYGPRSDSSIGSSLIWIQTDLDPTCLLIKLRGFKKYNSRQQYRWLDFHTNIKPLYKWRCSVDVCFSEYLESVSVLTPRSFDISTEWPSLLSLSEVCHSSPLEPLHPLNTFKWFQPG